jgi:hypothetical protein
MPKIRFTEHDLRMAEARRALYAHVAALLGAPGELPPIPDFSHQEYAELVAAEEAYRDMVETEWNARAEHDKNLPPKPDAGRLIERIFLGHNSVHRKVAIRMRSGGADYTAFVSPAEARRIGMDVFIQADKAEGKKPN